MYQEKQLSQPLTLSEPVQFHYLARGRMYVKLGLPTDATYQIGCYGETFKAYTGLPMPQITVYLDRVTLKTAKLYIKGGEVVDHDHQRRLPYTWVDGHCPEEGVTFLWNVTDPQYCPVAVVNEFLGQDPN